MSRKMHKDLISKAELKRLLRFELSLGNIKTIEDIENAIDCCRKEQQPVQENWIPVSCGYPTEEGWYWVTDNFDCITTELIRFMPKVHGTFEEFMDFFDHKVIAWMPAILPQPYKESE